MELGERIAAWRKAAGLSQRELAESLGLTYPAVYQWEHGSVKPSVSNLERLVGVLGITMECFYGATPLLVDGKAS